jgi:tetratricopeptide (TPR) repeat protein
LLPTDDPTRVELLGELADALMEEGQFDEARSVVADGVAVAERLADARLLARIRISASALSLVLSELESIEAAIDEAHQEIAALESAGDETGLARAWRHLMIIHGMRGAYDDAADAAKKVVEHARAAGDGRQAARGAMGYATTALLGPTPVSEALATCERLAREVEGDRKAESVVLGVMAQLHSMSGDFELARTLYKRAGAILADLGPSITSSTLSTESSRVESLAGDFEAAERELRRDDLALAAMGERLYRSTVDALLAQVLVTLGNLDEAADFAKLAEELSDPDDVSSQVFWRTARARLMARTGDLPGGERHALEAVEMARQTVDIALLAGALADLAEVLALAGRQDETGPPLREALALYERKGDVTSVARVRRLLEAPSPV